MIKNALRSKLGSALMVSAVVVSVGAVATVSAAHKPNHQNNPNPSGYGKDQCKNGGWQNFKNADGTPMFKNQGQCVAFFARGGGNTSTNENHTTQNTTINQNPRSGNADNGASSGNVSASANTSVSSTTNSSTSN